MASSDTVLSVGGVLLSATGGTTGDLLYKVSQAFAAASLAGTLSVVTVTGGVNNPGPTSFPAADTTPGETDVLIVPASDTGSITIPSGYKYIVYQGDGTIFGATSSEVVIGDLNVGTAADPSGAATVLATGTGTVGGAVYDSLSGAVLSFFSGTYVADGTGAAQTYNFDSPVNFDATIGGAGSTVLVGTPADSGGGATVAAQTSTNFMNVNGADETVSIVGPETFNFFATGTFPAGSVGETFDVASGFTVLDLSSATTINQTGGTVQATVLDGGSLTVNGGAGDAGQMFVFDGVGGNLIQGGVGGEVLALGAGALATTLLSAAGGNDLIFANAAVDYVGTPSSSLVFAGSPTVSTGAATVAAAGNSSIFSGLAGGSYTVGGTSFFFVGGGGADSVTETAGGASPAVWGNTNESLTVSGAGTSVKADVVALGNNDAIDLSATDGGNTFLVYNQMLSTGNVFAGNTTLTGSDAGGDGFALFVDSTSYDHTITIDNWKPTDTMFISNLDGPLSTADDATIAAFLAGGSGNTLTLSDGTKVVFNGGQPTDTSHLAHN